MPVQKFRSFDDASRALSDREAHAPLAERIAALWSLSAALAAPLGFQGVRKYATLDEADADRRRMVLARPHRPGTDR